MPICDYEKLTPDLEPLENVKINLEGIHLLQLKANFNQEEVQHFVNFIGSRVYAYQVLRFLDFLPKKGGGTITENVELVTGYTNQINKEAGLPDNGDFYKFTLSIKDQIDNKFTSVNNGEAKIQVDWVFSCAFIDLTELKQVIHFNQEDLPFKEAQGCYFGRSVLAVLMQEYHALHKDTMLRNFNILTPQNNPVLAKAAIEHLSKQRDLKLNRQETIEHLGSLKCVASGKVGTDILKEDFSLV